MLVVCIAFVGGMAFGGGCGGVACSKIRSHMAGFGSENVTSQADQRSSFSLTNLCLTFQLPSPSFRTIPPANKKHF